MLEFANKLIMKQQSHLRVVVAVALVLVVTVSLWFAAPVKALNITVSSPSSRTIGKDIGFDVTITIEDTELLPITSVDLEIYNSSDPDSYTADVADLPLSDGTKSYTNSQTGGGPVTIDAEVDDNWGYAYGYRSGYGYEQTDGWGYQYFGYGYGYGASGSSSTASITYNVVWSSPSSWPSGNSIIKVKINAGGKTFIKTRTISLSEPASGGGLPTVQPEEGVTDVSDNVDDDGTFTNSVIVESSDGTGQISIPEGTIGLTKDGGPLSTISFTRMSSQLSLPDGFTGVALPYEAGPEGATFNPYIEITLPFDPALIPPGMNTSSLVICFYVNGELIELPGPFVIDPVNNTITAKVSHFSIFVVVAKAELAAFTISDLVITPAEITSGQNANITVTVTNNGDLSGTYEVVLKIDNVKTETRSVTVAGHDSQNVIFIVTTKEARTYSVDVNGLVSRYKVVAVAPPPSTQTPTPSTPATPSPSPPAPPPPPTAFNWWIIGGIIIAVIAVGVAVWMVFSRRRTV